ncbi:hypothetical protein HDU67_002932 [Dinochytrium kinnereticum]|nr:hypothetical protein HDU67_002932 [Dinochytrium kinnereticum]
MFLFTLAFDIALPAATPTAHQANLLPSDIFEELLPSYRVGSIQRLKKKVKHGKIARPFGVKSILDNRRFGSLTVEWFDFPPESAGDCKVMEDRGECQKADAGQGDSPEPSGATPAFQQTSGVFVPFRKGTTQLNAGVLHLYRNKSEVPDILEKTRESDVGEGNFSREEVKDAKGPGNVLCVLSVPSYMTAQDFLSFVGPFQKNISHIRIIRDSIPNRFIGLIKLRDSRSTDSFYRQFSGKRFNSLDSEVCHVVYVKNVQFTSQVIPSFAFTSDNDTLPGTSITPLRKNSLVIPQEDGLKNSHLGIQTISPSQGTVTERLEEQMVEMPICPVCLDRMDSSVTGLLTILCQHTFHCHCLSKWEDSSCPVCRYCQKDSKRAEEDSSNECADCGSKENLWICLICGNLGCGRYQAAHAAAHFNETSHTYALEIETQRVWDYAGDGYVHRLIQNKADGKLVELPAPVADMENRLGGLLPYPGPKSDEMGLEYSYILISQLESQRLWYESKMAELEQSLVHQISEASAVDPKPHEQESTDERQKELDRLRIQMTAVVKEKRVLERRIDRLSESFNTLETKYQEEKEINEALRRNQDSWRTQLQAKEKELEEKEKALADMADQVRDLMFYLETQQKVDQSPLKDELQGGTIVIEDKPNVRLSSIHCGAVDGCPFGKTCWFSHDPSTVLKVPTAVPTATSKRGPDDLESPKQAKQIKKIVSRPRQEEITTNVGQDKYQQYADNPVASYSTQAVKPLSKSQKVMPERKVQVLGRPMIQGDLYSKVPRDKRQKALDHFYKEYVRIFEPILQLHPSIAGEHALKQEKALLSKATSLTYLTMANPILNRLKKRPVARNIEDVGIDGEWKQKVDKPPMEAVPEKASITVDDLRPLCLSDIKLVSMGYNLISMQPKDSVFKSIKRTMPCERCHMEFTPRLILSPEDREVCRYHKAYMKTRILSQVENVRAKSYLCCNMPQGSVGCTIGPHVFKESDFDSLNQKIQFTTMPDNAADEKGLVALDCEMVYTSGGMELARVTVIDASGEMLLDELMKTTFPIVDFNTEWSGITSLDGAKYDLAGVKTKMGQFMSKSTIVVGHGLENDLNALRISHTSIIDTVALFPVRTPALQSSFPRHSLKYLADKVLGRQIQTGHAGHDPKEDAMTALDLVKLYSRKNGQGFVY